MPADDLSPQAVKLARRLQALEGNRVYLLAFVKLKTWLLALLTPSGAKVERIE